MQSGGALTKTVELALFSSRLITRPTVSNIEASPWRPTFPMRCLCRALPIQLIQQHDHQPSIYRDMFNEGEFGLHHIARLEADYGGANRNWIDRDLRKRVNCMPMVCGLAITTRVRVFIVTEIHSITDRILTTLIAGGKPMRRGILEAGCDVNGWQLIAASLIGTHQLKLLALDKQKRGWRGKE